MKKVLTMVTAAILVTSCTSKSGQEQPKPLPSTWNARAHEMIFDTLGTFQGMEITVQAVTVDTIYRHGDTVKLMGAKIFILE